MKKSLVMVAVLIVPVLMVLSLAEPLRSFLAVTLFLGAIVVFALGRAEPSWRERLF